MKGLKLVFHAFRDLFILHVPQMKEVNGYAFLVHPRNISDVYRKYPFLKKISSQKVEFFLQHFWPVTLSQVTGAVHKKDGSPIPGWIISIPITADQMMADRELAKKFIIKAAKLAEKKGASIVGLGALTASLTRGGLDISSHVNVGVNTGRLYTAKIVSETALLAANKLGFENENTTVAIVGAAGSIGTASAQILAKNKIGKFLLVDLSEKKEKVEKLEKKIMGLNPDAEVLHSSKMEDIKSADIIIAVTNKPEAMILSEHLKPGAVVVDDAQPSDVDENIVYDRKDVLILEGGVVHAPTIDTHFNFGLKHTKDLFSCLAETIILATRGYQKDFQVGEVFELDENAYKTLEKGSEALGFRLADFQNFLKIYSENDLDFVRSQVYN